MTIQATVYLAYNLDGDTFTARDETDALDGLINEYGHCGGCRVIQLDLTLPPIKVPVAEIAIPDSEGDTVTVAIS